MFQHGLAPRPGATVEKPNGAFLTAQIDGGNTVWRSIVMTLSDGTALATVYIFNQAIGSFTTGKEYWYVNRNALSELGRYDLTISVTDHTTTTAPGDPGYTSEQKFAQAQSPGWGTGWTTDPLSGGDLYAGPSSYYLRIRTTTGTPPTITYVTWYQVRASGSPANLDPAGSWTADGSGSVSVPSGSTGYDINQSSG